MKLEGLTVTLLLACVLLCSPGWAQQKPDPQSLPETSTKSARKAGKEKHWSGSLVDAGCMARTLGAEAQASTEAEPTLEVPHLAGGDPGSPQAGPTPGVAGQGGMGPAQHIPEPGLPTQISTPDLNADQRAQLDQVDRVENAAKACVASPLTQALGLATPDGQVMQFDPDGNAKVRQALKEADVQPGKKVKAKVTGTMKDKNTVNVAAVEVKGEAK